MISNTHQYLTTEPIISNIWFSVLLLLSILLTHQVFVLSGGHVAPVYVAAEKLGIRVIDVRHEVCHSH